MWSRGRRRHAPDLEARVGAGPFGRQEHVDELRARPLPHRLAHRPVGGHVEARVEAVQRVGQHVEGRGLGLVPSTQVAVFWPFQSVSPTDAEYFWLSSTRVVSSSTCEPVDCVRHGPRWMVTFDTSCAAAANS